MIESTFFIEEYKALRQEIDTKLKDRLEFTRRGLIAVAALYSYIFSHAEYRILFLVPVALCIAMIVYLMEEFRMVALVGMYIERHAEPGALDEQAPWGWERWLRPRKTDPVEGVRFTYRWEPDRLKWPPLPIWVGLLVLTIVIAIGAYAGCYPSPSPGDLNPAGP